MTLPIPPPDPSDINVWEAYAILVSFVLLADFLAGRRVVVHCDNTAAVSWYTKGGPRPPAAVGLLQAALQIAVHYHVRISIEHVEGASNVLADALSRRQWEVFYSHLADWLAPTVSVWCRCNYDPGPAAAQD